MGHFVRTARAVALAAIGVTVVSLTGLVTCAGDAEAAKAKPKPAAPANEADQQKASAAATRQAYEAGIKSYSAGKFQPAADQLSSALRGGGLASSEMAKALYTRGLAYKKLSKPGLAISDLTSALWLKNGLGEADQKSAMAERSEAYRMAGLGEGNSGADKVSVADPNPAPAGAKASAPATPAPAVASAPTAPPVKTAKASKAVVPAAGATPPPAAPVAEITRQSPDSEAARDAAAARKVATAPVDVNGIQGAVASGLVAADTARPAASAQAVAAVPTVPVASAPPTMSAPFTTSAAPVAPVLAAAPIEGIPPATVPPSTSGPSTVSGFFSNIFSGGSPSAPAATQGASPVTTASTSPSAAGSANWADTTSVAGGAKKVAAVAPAAAAPVSAVTAPAAAKMTPGKYKLHIAAVRSRAEAEALAQKLASQQGPALKSRMPVVDEAVIGSMGTFYRVRVGSFATPDESRGICNSLRSSGFDCLVVTN